MAERTTDDLARQIENYLDSQTQNLDDEAFIDVMQKIIAYGNERIDTKSGSKPTRRKGKQQQ